MGLRGLLGLKPAVPADRRRGRVVAVIDCILNQNVRDAGAARFPAMNRRLVELCMRYQVAMVQMPCPEMRALGLARTRAPGQSIRQALDTPAGWGHCRALAVEVTDTLQAYVRDGQEVVAILGGNEQSPGCAVHIRADAAGKDSLTTESGLFVQALADELDHRDLHIPLRGIRDADPVLLEQDLDWFEELLRKS